MIGERLYATLRPARVECPACGTLIAFGSAGHLAPHRTAYDPRTSRLKCPECGKVYYVGILLWDAPLGGKPIPPPDTIANRQQLLTLRAYAGGFWRPGARRSRDVVNAYVRAVCECPPLPWRAECPIHGMRTVKREPEEPEGEPE